MAKNFKKAITESRGSATPMPMVRVAVPQVDPGESGPLNPDGTPGTIVEKARAVESAPAVPNPPSKQSAPPKVPKAKQPALAMPPSRQQEVRAQFNTKLPPELIDRIKNFSMTHHSDIQDVTELALDEFLTPRGF
ncbi:hypothetical protein [Streptomyces hokutonensis]|uniref:hypothetical protein n=1 Tax=Streptomyces hokutonensis TaxID=1306990 RepID=UPI003807504E